MGGEKKHKGEVMLYLHAGFEGNDGYQCKAASLAVVIVFTCVTRQLQQACDAAAAATAAARFDAKASSCHEGEKYVFSSACSHVKNIRNITDQRWR